MVSNGPIVLVEDDFDDQEIIAEVFSDLGIDNQLTVFSRCSDAYTYLTTTTEQPFLILCDINLPQMTGLEFKQKIDEDVILRQKAIPFIFFSTTAEGRTVKEAFSKTTVQGFFQKKGRYEDLKEILYAIMLYWRLCKHPSGL